jgi:hypothetical protein
MTQVPVTVAYAPAEALGEGEVTMKSDIYSLGLLMMFVITGKHPFDPSMKPLTLMMAITRGAKVELWGVRPELIQLVKLMVSVQPEERPGSANAVFEEICRNDFAFFESIDPVKIRVELAKFGIVDKSESKVARAERENVALKAEMEPLRQENARLTAKIGSLEAENAGLKAEIAAQRERIATLEAENAQLKPRPEVGVATFAGSMAQPYVNKLKEWLPWLREARLLQKMSGRDAASVNGFIEAAKGRSKTITFVETENGGSICGGYLESAWVESGGMNDRSRRSFLFTLKNHLSVPPTKFAQKQDGRAAYVNPGSLVHWGQDEGWIICSSDFGLRSNKTFEEAPGKGAALFCDDGDTKFRAGRWELWQLS